MDVPSLSRTLIWGFPGSGKTTLAYRLRDRLGLPVIEIDSLTFDPGWKMATAEVIEARFQAAIAANPDGWVVDGNYPGISRFVLPQVDAVIWLDLPFHTTFRRILRRTVRAVLSRDLALGHSRMTWTEGVRLVRFVVSEQMKRETRARQVFDRLATVDRRVPLIRLRTERDVNDLLDHLARMERPPSVRDAALR